MIAEDPSAFEQIPTGTYAELVQAQIAHDKQKREQIDRTKREAMESLKAL